MPIPSRPFPLARADDETAASAEARGLRWLLVVGAVVQAVVSVVEWSEGVANPWDRWSGPALSALFLAYAGALARWPQHTFKLRLAAVITFNGFLGGTLLALLFATPPPLNQYQFMTTVYWVPLGYGTAFVFLRARVAVVVSAGIFASMFVPLGVAMAMRGPEYWGEGFVPLAAVLAVAQIVYIVLWAAVATLRAGYRRADEEARRMHSLARTDPLTGLPNRRATVEWLQAALAAAQRHGEKVSAALIDVDHFKRINDRHGHASGDRVLQQVGPLLAAQLRSTDHLGRWGGEEFLMVCRHSTLQAALELAERLRRSVEGGRFAHGEGVTISVGVAACRPGDDAQALVARADKALYRAKEAGRNLVEPEGAAGRAVAMA